MTFTKKLIGFYSQAEAALKDKGIMAGKSGRHMKFPYTFSSKIAQFPLFFYMRENNIWMFYPMGMLLGLYCFCKIHRIVNSPENVTAWAEQQRKVTEKEHHH